MSTAEDQVVLLPATPEIADVASRLLYLSVAPLADYWMGVDDSQTAHAILLQMFRARRNLFSHEFAEFAQVSGEPAGFELSYPARTMKALELRTLLQFMRAAGLPTTLRMVRRSYPLESITQAGFSEYFLAHLAVLPGYEGRGLGRQLLQRSIDKARASGHGWISLTVDAENRRAMALYGRLGFTVTSTFAFEHLRRRFGYHGYHHMTKALG